MSLTDQRNEQIAWRFTEHELIFVSKIKSLITTFTTKSIHFLSLISPFSHQHCAGFKKKRSKTSSSLNSAADATCASNSDVFGLNKTSRPRFYNSFGRPYGHPWLTFFFSIRYTLFREYFKYSNIYLKNCKKKWLSVLVNNIINISIVIAKTI